MTAEFTIKYICDRKLKNDRVYQAMYQNKTAFFKRLSDEEKQRSQRVCDDCSTSLWDKVEKRYIDLPKHSADWEVVI